MRILAFHAHPDDIEFECLGVLFLLAERGHEVALANVNSGSCGSATLGPREIEKVRLEEARQAADLLGASYDNAGIPDLESVFDNACRRKVIEIVRRRRPDVLLTHYPVDYMADHEIASRLVVDAAFTATLCNYATGAEDAAPSLARIPHLYYCSPVEGTDRFGKPAPMEFGVNVETVMDRKVEALCRHASQREWLRHQHGMDEYVDFLKREAQRMGAPWGHAFGESFSQHRGHPFPRGNLLAAMLAASAPSA